MLPSRPLDPLFKTIGMVLDPHSKLPDPLFKTICMVPYPSFKTTGTAPFIQNYILVVLRRALR
ncbi:hypothetical protein Goe2_c02900 [Bacillus phage vB_BsuM-Goe2]|uniref:Uncharacterized protein n=1 Tax=Bacillus phage vB_BsuM-Goe2 TaxID=1933062 RepID=A0A217EQG6_9CAUD|nr:hypothetical protein Goe2_c02900 [Bacillus phage vB_BsuM-Goe2]